MDLIDALMNGNLARIKQLLDNGTDINYKDINGNTSLMVASNFSNTTSSLDTVKLLLEYGADVDAKNNRGQTSLIFASQSSNDTSSLDTVKLLLDNGADVNAKDNISQTSLMSASRNSNSSLDTVKLLLEYGADVNAKDNRDQTSLIVASKFSNDTSSLETVKFLLEYGADVFDKNINNKYPLDFCPTEECKEIISNAMWDKMYKNVKLQSNKLKNKKIAKDIWELIFLRNKQKALCKDLSKEENKYILQGFANMMNIPITEEMNKRNLCTIISKQLSWGGKYGKESVSYMKRKDTINKIINFAKSLGINTTQSINKILDDISSYVI